MTPSQPNLLGLAKQGNVKAIAALINRQLQPRGITAKASLKDNCLQVMLEANQVPDQQALVAFIRKGITNLAVPSIGKVKVYGKQADEDFPAWSEAFDINSQQSVFSGNDFALQKYQTPEQPSSTLKGTSEAGLVRSKNLSKPTQPQPARPRSHLASSILIILLAVLPVGIAPAIAAALPFGIGAIILDTLVKREYRQENYEAAKSVANVAKILRIVGGGITVFFYFLLCLLVFHDTFDPSNQRGRAKEAEAKNYVGSINRAQQFYRLEHPEFVSSMHELEIGVLEETTDYSYSILHIDSSIALTTASAKEEGLKSYTGAVFELPAGTTVAIACQTDRPSKTPPEAPTLIGSSPTCASGSSEMSTKY